MEQRVFERFRAVIHRESGISLSDEKKPLLQNRIRKRLRALSLSDETEYLRIIELEDVNGEELVHLIDAISTNLTFFFREVPHFELLGRIFDQYRQERRREVKLWCAAASSGEEPYSLAITGGEHLTPQGPNLKLLATDICTTVLDRAIKGLYTPEQLRDVKPDIRTKYFNPVRVGGEPYYHVKPCISQPILFKKLNLASFPYPVRGPFDIIFCRNVMIYFENDLRAKLIENFKRLLVPGGYLFVGHSESLSSIEHGLESVQSAVYRKR